MPTVTKQVHIIVDYNVVLLNYCTNSVVKIII